MNPDMTNVVGAGYSWSTHTEVGAFLIGFGLVMVAWAIGWTFRQVKFIGHSGGGGE